MADALLDIEFQINPQTERELRTITKDSKVVKSLLERIHRQKFSKRGTLNQMIKDSGAPDQQWWALTWDYVMWKIRMKQTGAKIPGETVSPKTVISVKRWIRTGKTQEAVSNMKPGRFKTLKYRPLKFWSGGEVYRMDIKKIDYVHYANEERPLFVWLLKDMDDISQIALEWLQGTLLRRVFPGEIISVS